VDDAHQMFMELIDLHLPGYLEEDDRYGSYEYIEDLTEEISSGDLKRADLCIDEVGLEFELEVCALCIPRGMN
jgi:hypothetical protein